MRTDGSAIYSSLCVNAEPELPLNCLSQSCTDYFTPWNFSTYICHGRHICHSSAGNVAWFLFTFMTGHAGLLGGRNIISFVPSYLIVSFMYFIYFPHSLHMYGFFSCMAPAHDSALAALGGLSHQLVLPTCSLVGLLPFLFGHEGSVPLMHLWLVCVMLFA